MAPGVEYKPIIRQCLKLQRPNKKKGSGTKQKGRRCFFNFYPSVNGGMRCLLR